MGLKSFWRKFRRVRDDIEDSLSEPLKPIWRNLRDMRDAAKIELILALLKTLPDEWMAFIAAYVQRRAGARGIDVAGFVAETNEANDDE